jgi:phage-related protein
MQLHFRVLHTAGGAVYAAAAQDSELGAAVRRVIGGASKSAGSAVAGAVTGAAASVAGGVKSKVDSFVAGVVAVPRRAQQAATAKVHFTYQFIQ